MNVILSRLFFLLRNINLATLYFSGDLKKLKNFLRKINTIFLSYSCSPIHPIELSELLGHNFYSDVFVPIGHIKPGSTPLVDLTALAVLTKKKSPKQIFEIGTFEGLTSIVFARNASPEAKVFTLDLPPREAVSRTRRSYKAQSINIPYESGHLIDVMGCCHQVKKLIGDSALFDFEPYNKSIDLFFIDGAHSIEYVARDSLNAFKSIVADGWVIWHDCFVPQVFRVIRQIAKYHQIYYICDTNLAVTLQKPDDTFPWKILESEIH